MLKKKFAFLIVLIVSVSLSHSQNLELDEPIYPFFDNHGRWLDHGNEANKDKNFKGFFQTPYQGIAQDDGLVLRVTQREEGSHLKALDSDRSSIRGVTTNLTHSSKYINYNRYVHQRHLLSSDSSFVRLAEKSDDQVIRLLEILDQTARDANEAERRHLKTNQQTEKPRTSSSSARRFVKAAEFARTYNMMPHWQTPGQDNLSIGKLPNDETLPEVFRVVLLIPEEEAKQTAIYNRLKDIGTIYDGVPALSYQRILVPVDRLEALADIVSEVRSEPHAYQDFFGRFEAPIRRQILRGTRPSGEAQGPLAADLIAMTPLHHAGYRGREVSVAILDSGFIGLSEAIEANLLPGERVHVQDLPTSGDDDIETRSTHGTRVLKQLVDIAPEADYILFKTFGFTDNAHALHMIQENNIRLNDAALSQSRTLAPIQIVSISRYAVNTSFYDNTGIVSDLFNDHVNEGHLFLSASAGNLGLQHWQGVWQDSQEPNILDFGGGQNYLSFRTFASVLSLWVNWDQYTHPGPLTDLDIYLYRVDRETGQIIVDPDTNRPIPIASSEVRNAIVPAESIYYSMTEEDQAYNFALQITRYDGDTTDLKISFFVNHAIGLEPRVQIGSTPDIAVTGTAVTVGAINGVRYADGPPIPIKPASSRGPTNEGRIKPDLIAPDGTYNAVTDRLEYGTSFAAPVVAGTAAVLRSARPDWSTASIQAALFFLAEDRGELSRAEILGLDSETTEADAYGFGRLSLRGIDLEGEYVHTMKNTPVD